MFYASLCDQQETSVSFETLSEQHDNLLKQLELVATKNKSLRGNILLSAIAHCCPFFLFNSFNVSFAVAKEKAEDEGKAIAFELEQAKKKIDSDEINRIEYEFKLDT